MGGASLIRGSCPDPGPAAVTIHLAIADQI
jgi:hypothetical protein